MEVEVGRVTHYYSHLHVAAVKLSADLKEGDFIHILGRTTDFMQRVTSLEVDHHHMTGVRHELLHYDLNDEVAAETGLICGGQMDVFIEPVSTSPDLYVLGAGHVGARVAALASTVGFRVHIVDDREKFASADRFPEAAEVVVDSIPGCSSSASSSIPPPTWSLSRGAIATISRPCGRSRAVI